ncbi:MAG: hypothetical protein GX442_06765 [Candidatus Riflebacteria bacterium]|nr:hypothetical protein [Candidatus Riflebacteria bacterium]
MVVFLAVVFVLTMSYRHWIHQEMWKAHRVYWNDQVTKAAEGLAEEAFAWFQANPDPAVNPVHGFLCAPFPADYPGTTDLRSDELDLTTRLRFGPQLADLEITDYTCTLQAVSARPFFRPVSPDTPLDAAREGEIFPDPREKIALLLVRVDLGKRGFRRRYEVVREVKVVSLLPGPFAQFTLFVREKAPGRAGDPNHLQARVADLEDWPGYADGSSPLGSPLELIHHPDDYSTTGISFPPSQTNAHPAKSAWMDLSRRGWVFLGGPDPAASGHAHPDCPLHVWGIHPLYGSLAKAKAHPEIFPRFYGGSFLLSSFYMLVFHSRQPDLAGQFPAAGFAFTGPPFNGDPAQPFRGVLLSAQQFGWYSGYRRAPGERTVITDYNRNQFSKTAGANLYDMPLDASLLLPAGSQFPLDTSRIIDRRSPTVFLGPMVFRLRQEAGKITQMPERIEQQLTGDLGAAVYQLHRDYGSIRPADTELPYFEVKNGNVRELPHTSVRYDQPGTWGTVSESTASSRDFAGVTWNVLQVIPNPKVYASFMTKVVSLPGMAIFDVMTQNNMNNVTAPSGWVPKDHSITAMPGVVRALDDSGAIVPDDPARFFYSSRGRGMNGNRLLLTDEAGDPLVRGNLAAVWPLSEEIYLPADPAFSFKTYDLRQKTSFLVEDAEEFRRRFIRTSGSHQILDLGGGIVTIAKGDLVLGGHGKGTLFYRDGGMILVSEGQLTIRSPVRRLPSAQGAALTLATAPKAGTHRDIVLDIDSRPALEPGCLVEAFLIASGRLKRRRGSLSGTLRGGVSVQTLDFSESDPDSLFRGHPSANAERSCVVWDPVFNIFQPTVRAQAVRLHLGPAKSYWRTEPL